MRLNKKSFNHDTNESSANGCGQTLRRVVSTGHMILNVATFRVAISERTFFENLDRSDVRNSDSLCENPLPFLYSSLLFKHIHYLFQLILSTCNILSLLPLHISFVAFILSFPFLNLFFCF